MGDMLHDMSLEALAEAIEGNLFALFKSFGALPGAEVRDEDDYLRFVTGIDSPMFNGVARAHLRPSGDLSEKIGETLAPFKERNLPAFWWTGPQTQPVDLDELLLEAGLEENFVDVPGMAVDLTTLHADTASPSGLSIEHVGDVASLDEWGRIFNTSYSTPGPAGEAWVEATRSLGFGEDVPWRLYLARLEGEAVAVSILFLGAGVAGLYGIGTVPTARGQGIGTAIIVAPLLDARDLGYRVGILHASDMGVEMCRNLGFKEYCKINRYVLRPSE